ncbi:hypothetical protein [Flavobacterium sp.]|uniref:hypothetical protein n=1 Tax=Flavobacterium sp. TaxID=239 RepID=UPI0028BEBF45|nr:hypothetical protein [Flavobacterium sp.]
MKRIALVLLLAILSVGCKKEINEQELTKLNGYWEIEKAELPDGSHKDYTINPTVDFFQIKDKKGFRKKVMPQLDGKYLMNDLSETVEITSDNGTTFLSYKTPYAKWKEELVALSDDKMVVKNEQDIEYYYKRPQKFSVK